MGVVDACGGRVTSGSIRFAGKELVGMGERSWNDIRGVGISMIFQQPTQCLNPAFTVVVRLAKCFDGIGPFHGVRLGTKPALSSIASASIPPASCFAFAPCRVDSCCEWRPLVP